MTLGRLAAILGVDAVAVRLVVVDHLGVRSDEGERCRTEVLEVLPSTCLGTDALFQFFLHTGKEYTRGNKKGIKSYYSIIDIGDERNL